MTHEQPLAASTCRPTRKVLHSLMNPRPTSYRPLKSASRGHITVPNWRSKLSTKKKIFLFHGLWLHLVYISDVIGTNSCIVKCVATHKARDLPEHVQTVILKLKLDLSFFSGGGGGGGGGVVFDLWQITVISDNKFACRKNFKLYQALCLVKIFLRVIACI